MKQRPILVAVIGYIIGILWGLYFQFGMVLCYILILTTYFILKAFFKNSKKRKFKLLSIRRYSRYLKLIFDAKVIFIIAFFSFISNGVIQYQNQRYENSYQDGEKLQVIGIVVSQKIEKQYYDLYQIKLFDSKSFDLYIQVNKKSKELAYGDKIQIQGEYKKPAKQRNYGGYDEVQYLKILKIIGKIKVNQVEVLARKQLNLIKQMANDMNLALKKKIESNLEKEKASILKGLLLGDTTQIEEETKENFRNSNISHILAISGMHVGYIAMAIQILCQRLLGKRKTKVFTIAILIFYVSLTGFSPSIIRAVTLTVLTMGAELINRKRDTWNAIAISLFGILIYNPFLIFNVGLQLSYIGTVGIILFRSIFFKILNFIKGKKLKEILAVSLATQITILPILLYHFNTIGIYFLITNLLVSLIIGPIMIVGFLSLMLKIFTFPLAIGIGILEGIAKFSELPFSKIYIATPHILMIFLYYIVIGAWQPIYKIYHSDYLVATQQRTKNLVALFCYRFREKKKKYEIWISVVLCLIVILNFLPQNLKIHFVDVGQGDCTFIVTPQRKTILVDGGGSLTKEFNVGKKIVLPYLLKQGYTKIDYVIISHFDQDHVRFYFIFIKRDKSKKYYNWKTI